MNNVEISYESFATRGNIIHEDFKQDIYDYISVLFCAEDSSIRNSQIVPEIRIKELNKLIREITHKIYLEFSEVNSDSSDFITEIIASFRKNYLLRIIGNLFTVNPFNTTREEAIPGNLVFDCLYQIGYLDSVNYLKKIELKNYLISLDKILIDPIKIKNLLLILFQDEQEFSFNYLNSKNTKDLRDVVISDFFKGDLTRYFNTFKNKLLDSSIKLYKQILLEEMKSLDNDKLERFIEYFMSMPPGVNLCFEQSLSMNNAKLLLQCESIVPLMKDGQREFCNSLRIIKNKINMTDCLKLAEDDQSLISLLCWLKSDPSEAIDTIHAFNELTLRGNIFSENNPNFLYLYLNELIQEQKHILKIPIKRKSTVDFKKPLFPDDSREISEYQAMCDRVKQKVTFLVNDVSASERKLIKKIRYERSISFLKRHAKQAFVFFMILISVFIVKYSYNYFFDIESIYKNQYLKQSVLSLNAILYPPPLKDSIDPMTNEVRQKQRLDYIKDLNIRYFKVISIFLQPAISEGSINEFLSSVSMPDGIKDKKSIKIVRKNLMGIINKKEWHNKYESLIGINIITEFRSYGSIANFLIPPLSHYVLKNINGLPVRQGNRLLISKPVSEKILIRKELINRFGIINSGDDEPKGYIDKFDENYKDIVSSIDTLLERLVRRKKTLMLNYSNPSKMQDNNDIKNTLKTISILEIRLIDLKQKIKDRHDYIILKNTYMLELN